MFGAIIFEIGDEKPNEDKSAPHIRIPKEVFTEEPNS